MRNLLRVSIMLVLLATWLTLVQPVAAASPSFVVVGYGDTLYAIAARHGTTVQSLMRANGIPNPNFIYAGQRLALPTLNYAPGNAPRMSRRPAVFIPSSPAIRWQSLRQSLAQRSAS